MLSTPAAEVYAEATVSMDWFKEEHVRRGGGGYRILLARRRRLPLRSLMPAGIE